MENYHPVLILVLVVTAIAVLILVMWHREKAAAASQLSGIGYYLFLTINSDELPNNSFYEANKLFDVLNPGIRSSEPLIGGPYDLGIFPGHPSRSLLLGHPIPLPKSDLDPLAARLIKSWIKCVDNASYGRVKALASVAFGPIYFSEGTVTAHTSRGVVHGPTYYQAVKVTMSSILSNQWVKSKKDHLVLMNEAACVHLKVSERGFEVQDFEASKEKLYGAVFEEIAWKQNGKAFTEA